MAEERKIVTVDLVGRKVKLRLPTEDQLVAWLGLAGGLSGQDEELDGKTVVEDVTLFLDAMLDTFVDDDDRRAYRRAVTLGQATLSDLFQRLTEQTGAPAKPVRKATTTRARRA